LAGGTKTGHDVGVALWLVVLIGVLLWLAASARRSNAGDGGRSRARGRITPGWWILAAIAAVLLVRFGLHWVAVAGGAVLAVARGVLPLVRLLPFFMQARDVARQGGEAAPRSARGPGEPSPGPSRAGRMSREEALQVLGLPNGASADDVTREYRRLMKKLHPDLGGSSYLAAKINEARDVLSRAL
jgi:hypothetical protein